MTFDPLISVSSTGRSRRFGFSSEADKSTADPLRGDALADLPDDATVDMRIDFGISRNIAGSARAATVRSA
ncbi:hypothetical protein [Amycolatopsis sp. NPDC049868]|uniref:hypothetical protein n=1 Tax=Amycolatopsis sp. NPDC049868 TaxID=3363934 RepID=UPI0037BB0A6D